VKAKLVSITALSLLSGAALADSDVTLYGTLDVGVLSQSSNSNPALGYLPNAKDVGSSTILKDGGLGLSYWGIKGSEDLGDGLKATFNLRGNITAPTGVAGGPNSSGGTSLFNQEANVGLSGEFGSVKAGRVIAPIWYAFSPTDVRGGAYFGSSLTGLVGMNSVTGRFAGGNSDAMIGTIYNDNAVVYTSPVWSGIVINAEYTFGGQAGNSSAGRQTAATVNYSDDHLKLDAIYYSGNDNGANNGTAAAPGTVTGNPANPPEIPLNGTNTNRLMQLGALYKFDALSLSAGYWKGSDPSNTGAGVNALKGLTTGDVRMINLGAGYRLSEKINLTSGAYKVTDQNHTDNTSLMVVVGGEYFFSKLTRLYLEGANVDNKGSNMNQGLIYAVPVTAGISSHAVMLGLRHQF
jgi:predicted porin